MLQTILVAEEDSRLTQRVCQTLAGRGYRVLTAQHCSEVIVRIAAEQIDLLVLDYALPGIGGMAVLQTLRADTRIRGLPIIMLACDMPTPDVFRAWNLGVDSLQSKRPDDVHALTLELAAKTKRIFKSIEEDNPPLIL